MDLIFGKNNIPFHFFKETETLNSPVIPFDITEFEDNYHIVVEVGSAKKENIKVNMANNILSIEINKTPITYNTNPKFKRHLTSSIKYGKTSQQLIYINSKVVDTSKIECKFEMGLVFITVPKKEIEKEKTEFFIN